ncbi:hypothetical protein HOLleu_44404 [Holothuria leucospilota]|uniref:Uncharacterized protein n=1 Tax=Holothuria leucospilota TaxID=206669 RepID=A0A9Q0YAY2_HOLLE|nr:hypothetical protein HOLleu_44404 [Holothuria leucospilota]
MLEIKHTQTADEKSLNNISESEGKDPMSSPPHSPQNKGCDSDTSDVQSNLAAGENHLTAHQNDNSLSDAVNTNTTGKDTSKETDFNTGDKDHTNEVISSDSEETSADRVEYLMLLDISSGVCNDSSSGEETTANTNEMPKIKHTQVIDKELTTDSSSSESEDEDPTYFPRRSPQSEEFDLDTSEEFPFYQRASSPHPSHQVSGDVPALQPNVLECSSVPHQMHHHLHRM